MAGDRAWQKCVIQSRLMKKSSIIHVHRLHGQHSGAHKTAGPLTQWERMGYFFAAQWTKVVGVAHDYAKCFILRLGPLLKWPHSTIPALQSFKSCTFLRRRRGCGKDLEAAASLWISWFGLMFNSWYSLHLRKKVKACGESSQTETAERDRLPSPVD